MDFVTFVYCGINLGIGGDEGMEITTQDGDVPWRYIPPWLSGLSSCSCIMVIKCSRVYAIVWCLFCTVPPMCFGTLVAVMDVTAAEESMIPMTTLSHLGGGQSERSEWLPKVSQWAELGALPMRAQWRTVILFGKDRKLYKCPVYTWETSFETALVTGLLLFVAPGCHLSDLSAGEFVLRVLGVSATCSCLVCAE